MAEIESRVGKIETKIDMFIGEIRQQNQMRAAEMREIRSKLDDIDKHVRNLAVAAIVGIGAIAAAVIGFVISVASK